MKSKMNMIYWKSEKFWLGKLLEHPEIMTQGENLEELETNIQGSIPVDGYGQCVGTVRNKRNLCMKRKEFGNG